MNARRFVPALAIGSLLALLSLATGQAAPTAAPPASFVQLDGVSGHLDVPDSPDLSVATTGALTVSAWMRPDTLSFPKTEGSGYVHWLGKGAGNQQEWTFRMYSQPNQENRANRISFYVFNLSSPQPPNLGIGSYFQDAITPGEWIHVVGVADGHQTRIFKDGVQRDCDQYNTASGDHTCSTYPPSEWITPTHGTAPLRMGTRDLHSFFQGGLGEVRIWNRALSASEIAALYGQDVAPRNGLVAEYLLSEGSGTTAHDTAGGHDATLVGATWSGTPPPTATPTPIPTSTPAPTPTSTTSGGSETITGTGSPIAFTPGQPFNGAVATFTDSDNSVLATDLQATIDWGEGGTSMEAVSGQSGAFQVSSSYTYTDPGTYTVQVTLTNTNSQTQGSVQTTASVAGQFLMTTFAGNGTAGYAGDGQAATGAQITAPSSLAADMRGNVYILDSGNYRVRNVDASGVIHTYAGNGTNDNKCGGGPALGVGFDRPLGLAEDAGGAVYVADYLCGMVFKIDPGAGNNVTTVAGSPCLGINGQACLPRDGGPATQTSLSGPEAVVVDKAGNLYISQTDANLVRKVDTHGTITTFAGRVDTGNPSFAGIAGYTGDGGPANQAELSGPQGLAVDDAGNVYIADSLNNAVREVDTSGTIHAFAGGGSGSGAQGYGGDGGPATAAELAQPAGLAFDTNNGLYIADSANSVVRYVDPSGTMHTLAGNGTPGFAGDGGTATAAELDGPGAVAVYDPGLLGIFHGLKVYITDPNNSRVRVAYLSPPLEVP